MLQDFWGYSYETNGLVSERITYQPWKQPPMRFPWHAHATLIFKLYNHLACRRCSLKGKDEASLELGETTIFLGGFDFLLDSRKMGRAANWCCLASVEQGNTLSLVEQYLQNKGCPKGSRDLSLVISEVKERSYSFLGDSNAHLLWLPFDQHGHVVEW